MTDYSDFRVLIDNAAPAPELGFNDYAQALSEIVRRSTPEFAIGIFGSWGTGKTTLMRQIDRSLGEDPDVVTAWFTAWRYEREPHLIVPLIDVLREALDDAAATSGTEPARRAAGKLRKAGRAFLAGLTLSAKIPGLEVQLDPGKVLQELEDEPDSGKDALSFYHAAFLMLRDAIQEFSAGGSRRVVIFVDDLDRCLPENALDVLESMKLFFDVQGCIFVVGLDQAVAERAVAEKYAVADRVVGDLPPVSGVDYLKKIFQVPFALPRVGTDQLRQYCWSMMTAAELGTEQLDDFGRHVSQHLEFLPDQDAVNPREIKRLINAYVLQVKMLSVRMYGAFDPNIVLALQIMSFRPDWRDLYEELAADPLLFQQSLRSAMEGETLPDRVWITANFVQLSAQIVQYLRGPAAAVLQDPQLTSYVSAAESSRSSDPSLLDAQVTLNRVREAAEGLADGSRDAGTRLSAEVARLSELLAYRSRDQSTVAASVQDLQVSAKDLMGRQLDSSPEQLERDTARLKSSITALEAELREMRRQSHLGASSYAS